MACASCPRSPPFADAGHLMARSAVDGASATVACASVKPEIRGSFTDHAASATTGCVPLIMGKLAMTVATATVGCVSVMTAGPEMPASSRRSVTYPTRRAKSSAETLRGWYAPTEVPVSVAAVCVTMRTTEVW